MDSRYNQRCLYKRETERKGESNVGTKADRGMMDHPELGEA